MTASKMLTQEQIDAGLRETRAAIERGRKTLEKSREVQAKTGLTPDKLQHIVQRLSPRARMWVGTLVSDRMSEITGNKRPAAKMPRKPRAMV
ncbi:hypothetical protein [Peristeroidobacter soli]|uniref:hypothetical protein n=1 Tax=Peristeroidobacter soli TaxID=2497877 RepID=UPI00101C7E86|nr:hypothetical protein [Peristeroidobacter soli]